jgi:hypothetical protein
MIRGKRWRVVDSEKYKGAELGYCTNPAMDREIAIPINGDEREDLIIICHEVTHGYDFGLSEKMVEGLSIALGDALWRLGWRKD